MNRRPFKKGINTSVPSSVVDVRGCSSSYRGSIFRLHCLTIPINEYCIGRATLGSSISITALVMLPVLEDASSFLPDVLVLCFAHDAVAETNKRATKVKSTWRLSDATLFGLRPSLLACLYGSVSVLRPSSHCLILISWKNGQFWLISSSKTGAVEPVVSRTRRIRIDTS